MILISVNTKSRNCVYVAWLADSLQTWLMFL